MKKKIVAGSTTITVDDTELQKTILNILRQAAPALLPALEEARDEVLAGAEKEWPVKSGKSKAGFTTFEKVTGDAVKVGIDNQVEYVYYIKANDLGGKSPWQELVVKPAKKKKEQITDKSFEDLRKLVGK